MLFSAAPSLCPGQL
ncbi:hypothetical protein [Paenibacillus sp. J45TS6]